MLSGKALLRANFSQMTSLAKFGIKNPNIYRNLSVPELYELALDSSKDHVLDYKIANTGALATFPGPPPPRPPGYKRIVAEPSSENDIWWGPANIPMSQHSYEVNFGRALDFMNFHKHLFVVEGYAGWHPLHRIPVRLISTEVHHALFSTTMLMPPSPADLQHDFENASPLHIIHAGRYPANELTTGVNTPASLDIHLGHKVLLLMGMQHSDEIKKALFSALHYILPRKNLLPLHASATMGPKGDVTLMFGLSGSGKTVLSHRTTRKLISDDENCWGNDGIFSLEGGCCVGLTRNNMKDVPSVALFGGLLENAQIDPETNEAKYAEHATVTYPISFLKNAEIPCMGAHPKNVILLIRDTFGVFPPVSKLTADQALYHFIAGYNGGIENGKAVTNFSACFGKPFLVQSPVMYADMLAERISKYGTKCWLINSGWSGGPYGTGHRMSVEVTRQILKAIHHGWLDNTPTTKLDVFDIDFPTEVEGIDPKIQTPWLSWSSKVEYDHTLRQLGMEFKKYTRRYEDLTSDDVKAAGPSLE